MRAEKSRQRTPLLKAGGEYGMISLKIRKEGIEYDKCYAEPGPGI